MKYNLPSSPASSGRYQTLPLLVGRTVSLLACLLLVAKAAAVEFRVPLNPGDTLFHNPDLVIRAYPGAEKYRWTFMRADGSGLGSVVGGVRVDKDTPKQNTRINVRVEPLDSRGRVIQAGVSETWFRTCSTQVELAAPWNGQHVGSPVIFSFNPLPRETSVYGYYLFVKSPGAAEPRRFDLSVNATAYLSTLAPGEHEWWVQARTKFDNDPESAHWIARVSSLPNFSVHPEGGEHCASEAVTLQARASAVPSFNYHWRRDGVDIPGATAPDFTVPPGEQGVYVCVAFNAAGAVISEPAVVTRVALPPVSVAASAYDFAPGELRIMAAGEAEKYQWWLDGQLLDEPGSELVLTEVPDRPFTLRAVAVHECGSVESAPLTLAPPAPLRVTRKSPAQIVRLGEAVELVLEASRTTATEWEAPDGVSEKGSPWRVKIAAEEQAGTYAVTARDGFGKVEQAVDVLAVVSEPADQQADEGESVTLSAEVAGGAPTIQWFKDGVALVGRTDLNLTLGEVTSANAGTYHFELKHLDSAIFRSRTSTLRIVPAPKAEPAIQAIRLKAEGKVELTITKGAAELALERSTDLDTWKQVKVLTQTGTFIYVDEALEDEDGVFYRLAEPTYEPQQPGISAKTKACIRATLAAYLGVNPGSLFLVLEEAVDWPNACLGCLPGACLQVITPGWRLKYSSGNGGRLYEVRLSAMGTVALVTGTRGVLLKSCD